MRVLATHVEKAYEVAMKIESTKSTILKLGYEAKIYRYLTRRSKGERRVLGIPRLYYYCERKNLNVNVMVIELLGPSLEELFSFCNRKFSLKTILMLADQLIERIEFVHSKYLLHRDIKPDNFLMGVGSDANILHVIDFGLAKKYRDFKTLLHSPYREGKNLTGTARYASLRTHEGIEQSRRDDLESIGFVLMYFCRGSLPWQGIRATSKKQKYKKIYEKKRDTSIGKLCEGYPIEFATYLNYARNLKFDESPDYTYLRALFRDLYKREGFADDSVYDWSQVAQASSSSAQNGS